MLAYLTERAAEIETTRGLVIPPDIAMRDRPLLYFRRFSYRFAHRGARKTICTFVSSNPDQVSIKFHEHILRGAAPPGLVLVDVTIVRRNKPRDFLRGSGIREVENPEPGVKPGDCHHRGI